MKHKNNTGYPKIYSDLVWSDYLSENQETYTIYPRNGTRFQTTQEHIRLRYPAIVGDLESSGCLRTTKDWVKLIRLMWKDGYRF